MNFFYSHLIEIEPLMLVLNELNIKDHHKRHLAYLIDSSLHHSVMDIILSELSEQDKTIFLTKLHQDPHSPDLMEFLNDRISKIEDKIIQAADELKAEIYKDIKEAKLQHG